MPKYIDGVSYTINAQSEKGRFTIPKEVRDTLGIGENENPPLHLVIEDAETGDILLPKALHQMTSGPEIIDSRTRAVIESRQRIRVRVSLAD